MEKTWKPTTAGILSIVAGAFGVIGGIVFLVLGTVAGGLLGLLGLLGAFGLPDLSSIIIPALGGIVAALGGIVAALAAFPLALGIVAIIGGIYAMRRQKWGLALAGAICALLCSPGFILGTSAIILVALGKNEFE